MTILLAGASGLVGSAFARVAARRNHRVVGTVGSFRGDIPGLAEQHALDLANEQATAAVVLAARPDAIVNCAAVSMPEQCEALPELSRALNVALPATLARIAQELGARFLHLSSEQVFDGSRHTPYSPGDAASPINLYGRQKLESERAVQDAAPELAVTLRAPLLMGDSAAGTRGTHERLFADWAAGRTPRLFADEFRQPCTAENLAEAMLELCGRREIRGVFHWAGAELLSRYAIGSGVRARFKLSENHAPLASVTRADVPELSRKRQPCLALDVSALAATLATQPQTFARQLAELHVPPACRAWYERHAGAQP